MHAIYIASIVFSALLVATLLGMRIRSFLPQHHLAPETKDAVRIGMGSVATMAALVLGLLVASAKSSYDTTRSEVIQLCAKMIYLDNVLTSYGPDAAPARAALRESLLTGIHRFWPDKGQAQPNIQLADKSHVAVNAALQSLPVTIQNLNPQTDAQRSAKTQAASLAADIAQMRWLIFEQNTSSISPVLLTIMVCWIALTFASVGLFAPANATAIFAQGLAALSVAGAVFLILELDQPLSGLIQISSEPALNALRLISQ